MLLDFITRHRAEILDHSWRRLSGENPGRPHDEVMSGLDDFVDELIEAFARDAGIAPARPSPFDDGASPRAHGLQRKRAGFEPWRVVQDYGSVCDSVTSIAGARGAVIPVEEFNLLNRAIDMAAARAIDGYWKEEERERAASSAERVGALAHELRNALHGAALGFAILRRNQVGVRSRTGDAVERALSRMDGLVRRALAESHLEAGAPPRRERVSAAALVDAVTGTAFFERGVRVEATGDPGLAVSADPVLIESALGNLLQNAIKFTADGGTVFVRARRDGGDALFEVEDRCGGLPPGTDGDALFRPFVQGADDRRGVGLGLSIARRAVEAHGGRVTVRNLPNVGCVFAMALPASEGDGDGAPADGDPRGEGTP